MSKRTRATGGSGTKLDLERVNGVSELPVELVPYKRTTSKSNNTGASSSFSAPEQLGSLMKKVGRPSTQSDRGVPCSRSHGIQAKWIVSIELV